MSIIIPEKDLEKTAKALTNWKTLGKSFTYNCPVIIKTTLYSWMTECFGRIKPRADGRWNYWRLKAKYNMFWNCNAKQGVAATKQAAMDEVEKGWDLIE